MSAPLNHPEPLCPTFPVPAAQVSLNTSLPYPSPHPHPHPLQLGFIASWECLVCPQTRPFSPSTHTHDRQSTMQVHAWTCTDGFQQRSEFPQQAWHDACRHGQIGLNPTASLAQALSAFAVTVSRWCLEAKFQSDISPLLTLPTSSPTGLSFESGGTEESCCLFEIFMQRQS